MSQSSIPKTRRRRRIFGIMLVAVVLLGVGLFVPGSPVYLPTLIAPELTVDGRTAAQLIPSLSDPDPDARRNAAADLGNLNVHATKALPTLLGMARNDPDDSIRTIATDAVRKMYPLNGTDADKDRYAAAVLNDLTAALSDPDPRVRMAAAAGLLNLKRRAAPAVPGLLLAADDTGHPASFRN